MHCDGLFASITGKQVCIVMVCLLVLQENKYAL